MVAGRKDDVAGRKDTAQRLLDAQVKFLVAQASGDGYAELVSTEVDNALESAATLTLDDVVTRDQIKAVAYKWATQTRLAGSIPEIVGEIAGRVYNHRIQDESRIGDVIDQRRFQELAAKLLEMETIPRILDRMQSSPVTARWASGFLIRVVADAVDNNRELAERVPGVESLLTVGGKLADAVLPELVQALDQRAREFAQRGAKFLLRRAPVAPRPDDNATLLDAAMDFFDDRADDPIGVFREFMTREDMEDLLVIAFEFWLGSVTPTTSGRCCTRESTSSSTSTASAACWRSSTTSASAART